MPNHCDNTTTIFGPPKDLAKLLSIVTLSEEEREASREPIRLSNLMPMPAILRGTHSPAVPSAEPNPRWAEQLAEGKLSQEEYDTLVAERIADFAKNEAARVATGHSDWYEWCLDNWGTKWGDYDHTGTTPTLDSINLVAEMASITFDYWTAWTPFDCDFWAKVSADFPTLRFDTSYYEGGIGFAGVISAMNGFVGEGWTGELPEMDWDDDKVNPLAEINEQLKLEADLDLATKMDSAEDALS